MTRLIGSSTRESRCLGVKEGVTGFACRSSSRRIQQSAWRKAGRRAMVKEDGIEPLDIDVPIQRSGRGNGAARRPERTPDAWRNCLLGKDTQTNATVERLGSDAWPESRRGGEKWPCVHRRQIDGHQGSLQCTITLRHISQPHSRRHRRELPKTPARPMYGVSHLDFAEALCLLLSPWDLIFHRFLLLRIQNLVGRREGQLAA